MSDNKGQGTAVVLLSVIKVLSLGTGMVTTMILSKTLSLEMYGTYSAANLLAVSATSIMALGLSDAVNYFFNSRHEEKNQKKYIDTIFCVQLFFGLLTAALLIATEGAVVTYFRNPYLSGMMVYIAFRPYLENAICSLQNLQIAIGHAKHIAVRNCLFSLGKMLAAWICTLFSQNIQWILASIIAMDLLTVLCFGRSFRQKKFGISPWKCDWTLLREILAFSLPMGVYILSNQLLRSLDIYVIGYFESTERLAIYSNCSANLPINIVSGSLMTVLIPLLTRAISTEDYTSGRRLFSAFLQLGYLSTWILGAVCIVFAPEAITILYSPEYLPGKAIFILYVLSDMIKFANVSIVLSAKGKTSLLMKLSVLSLAVNAVLNIAFYKWLGMIGPAIATVAVTLGTTVILCHYSAVILHGGLLQMLGIKHMLIYMLELAAGGLACYQVRSMAIANGVSGLGAMVVAGGLYCAVPMLVHRKKIAYLMHSI